MNGRPTEEPRYCVPCGEQGIAVAAHRIVNGVAKCDACYRNQEVPRVPVKEEKKVSKEIDWAVIQKRRDAGESVSDLAEELVVSNATVYNNTNANKSAAKKPKATVKKDAIPTNGNLLDELRKERDALNTVIEFLEKREVPR